MSDPVIETEPTTEPETEPATEQAADGGVPVFAESMGGALIDSARISVMAALSMLPPAPQILLAGEDEERTVHDCLDQAMQWLDAARVRTIEEGAGPPTSLHVVPR